VYLAAVPGSAKKTDPARKIVPGAVSDVVGREFAVNNDYCVINLMCSVTGLS